VQYLLPFTNDGSLNFTILLKKSMSPISSDIRNYISFVNQLNTHCELFSVEPEEKWIEKALDYVDGLAASELRRLVTLETRREFGAFFTPTSLARSVIGDIFPKLDANSIIYDPACGAGNLLLAAWDHLNENNIIPTNQHYLVGTDIHSEFVEAAKSRLAIKKLLLQLDNKKILKGSSDCFNIKQLDGLTDNDFYRQATHIFVNPPFNLIPVGNVEWSKGVASAAAVFLDRIIQQVSVGTTITAILPEVLRSGSRYHRWRGKILSNCTNEKVKLFGQFDNHSDVDVFAITLKKRNGAISFKNSTNKLQPEQKAKLTIHDNFSVCVGSVVDNRDEHLGKRRGYIVSRGLKGWSVQTHFTRTRKHPGKSFKGPIIVIKRTSRMGGDKRAIATILNTPNPVYIDNHLIVLVPMSGNLQDCQKAMESLMDARTDLWLNKEIRCRHLTVKVVSEIPLW
jgi:hypothetical protein